MRRDLKGRRAHISTTLVCPFHINTGFLKDPSLSPLFPVLSESDVADRVVDGVIHKDEVSVRTPFEILSL